MWRLLLPQCIMDAKQYHSDLKEKEVLQNGTTQVNLEDIMLSE